MKLKPVVLIVLATSIGALSLGFCLESNDDYQSHLLKDYSQAFYKATQKYDSVAQRFDAGKATLMQLKEHHLKTRIAFKHLEFYADFRYHEFVQDHINGAPLHKVKSVKNTPQIEQPEGLQTLDELLFSENFDNVGNELIPLTKKLLFSVQRLHKSLSTTTLSDAELIVALKLQLIRIFTLSLSGFDTPGSLNALAESEASLLSSKAFIQNSGLAVVSKQKLLRHLDDGLIYFKDLSNFESFDRLSFLREVINPLYRDLGELPIDTSDIDELISQLPINLQASSLFDPNFIDPYNYTELTKDQDSEILKQLGESLFYDPILSDNGQMNCATCHNPKLAFTDGLKVPKKPINGIAFTRNTPTLLNAVYANRYFYDLRAFTLEQQTEHVIFNTNEFNSSYKAILERLSTNDTYVATFRDAFNVTTISREHVLKVLASYVASLKSFNSKFDQYARGTTDNLSEEEKSGFNLFMGKAACATCHFPPTFAGLVPPNFKDSESEVLGVLVAPDSLALDNDEGRIDNGLKTERAWMFKNAFKTTTVRNINETAPYFHNGAYETLESVLDFYNRGGGAGQGLEVTNQTLSDEALNLSEVEIMQLIAFLKSLSDNPFLN